MAIDVDRWQSAAGQRDRRTFRRGDSPDCGARRLRSRARGEDSRSSGQGGIETTSDALEFFLAGASAISIGTANFTDPRIPVRIVEELAVYLQVAQPSLACADSRKGKRGIQRIPTSTKETKGECPLTEVSMCKDANAVAAALGAPRRYSSVTEAIPMLPPRALPARSPALATLYHANLWLVGH